jgi:hypothetical protein
VDHHKPELIPVHFYSIRLKKHAWKAAFDFFEKSKIISKKLAENGAC